MGRLVKIKRNGRNSGLSFYLLWGFLWGTQGKDSFLRRWGLHQGARGKQAKNRAVVAVARKLAVLRPFRTWGGFVPSRSQTSRVADYPLGGHSIPRISPHILGRCK